MTPATAIQTAIATALPLENVRTGLEQEDADRGIWCALSGGPPTIHVGGTAERVEQPRVRVFVRVGPRDHDELEALVHSARAAVNGIEPTDYAVSTCTQAIELAPDRHGRKAASFRVDLTIIES